jgi:hypothetical protein
MDRSTDTFCLSMLHAFQNEPVVQLQEDGNVSLRPKGGIEYGTPISRTSGDNQLQGPLLNVPT